MKYEELNDRAKEKARDSLRYIEADYDWWTADYNYFEEALGSMGFGYVTLRGFDLDRGSYVKWVGNFSGNVKRVPENVPDALHHVANTLCEIDTLGRLADENGYLFFNTDNTGGFGSRYSVDVDLGMEDENGDNPLLDAKQQEIESAMKEIEAWMLDVLRREFEWRTSDECVEECIKSNEYEFDEDGVQI